MPPSHVCMQHSMQHKCCIAQRFMRWVAGEPPLSSAPLTSRAPPPPGQGMKLECRIMQDSTGCSALLSPGPSPAAHPPPRVTHNLQGMELKCRIAQHSTGWMAGEFAALVQAQNLVLTHFSARYHSVGVHARTHVCAFVRVRMCRRRICCSRYHSVGGCAHVCVCAWLCVRVNARVRACTLWCSWEHVCTRRRQLPRSNKAEAAPSHSPLHGPRRRQN